MQLNFAALCNTQVVDEFIAKSKWYYICRWCNYQMNIYINNIHNRTDKMIKQGGCQFERDNAHD